MKERIRNSIDLTCSSPALQRLLHGLPVPLMLLWTWSVFFSSLARGADVPYAATRVRSDNTLAAAPEPIPTDSIKLSPPPRANNPFAAPPDPIPTGSIKISPPPRANNPFAAPPDPIPTGSIKLSPPPRANNPFAAAPEPMPSSDGPTSLIGTADIPSPSVRNSNEPIIRGIVITIVVMVVLGLAVIAIFQQVNKPETMFRFLEDITIEKPVPFTSIQLKAYTNNYSTILGSGGFGKVYLGKLPNGMQCAVKVLQRRLDTKSAEQFKAEVVTIGRTYHANLVRLYGFCNNDSLSALVYEYMSNGSLDKHLFHGDNNNNIQAIGSWARLYEIALGTAKGIAYLHEECPQRIIHYDIKPANILLDESFFPKVADFGLAKLCNMDQSHVTMTGYRGTPGYSAPEFLLHNFPIGYKCDVYSFGMLLFEILGRRKNTRVGANATNSLDWFPSFVWDKYEKGELNELTTSCGIGEDEKERAQRLTIVALWCVQDCPQERPRMSAVVKMLEGGVEIVSPPKPFNFMRSIRPNSSMGDSNSTSEETDSNWYKDNTKPKEFECEIQIEKQH